MSQLWGGCPCAGSGMGHRIHAAWERLYCWGVGVPWMLGTLLILGNSDATTCFLPGDIHVERDQGATRSLSSLA
jgi:hypothetical protein